jgi:hypothetical protein
MMGSKIKSIIKQVRENANERASTEKEGERRGREGEGRPPKINKRRTDTNEETRACTGKR